jgi:AraC family transcriptional regulator, regulatory protein of adaptative response / methylated-DNA-[protein]-cysteine methyltransferase
VTFKIVFQTRGWWAGDKEYESMVVGVVSFVEAPQIGLDLPLDVRGTAFQRRVWQALQDIPVGQTSSYSEIARKIGAPNPLAPW